MILSHPLFLSLPSLLVMTCFSIFIPADQMSAVVLSGPLCLTLSYF